MEHVNLIGGERRSAVGHHILDTCLMHGDDVGIALDHKHAIFLHNSLLGLIDAIELTLLMVDFRVGRVDIFLCYALGTAIKHTTTKGYHLATDIEPREDGTTCIAVVYSDLFPLFTFLFPLNTQARLHKELRLITLGLSRLCQRITLLRCITQLELLNDIIADATTAEILLANGDAVRIVLKYIVKPVLGPLVDDKHRLTLALGFTLLVSQFLLNNLDIVFLSQPAQGLRIGQLLVLH